MNPRRPLPLFLLTLLLGGAWACDRMSVHFSKEGSSKESSSSAEADRTRKMEEKAAEIERQAEDLRNMEGSDQDKIDAYNKLQQSQQELNSMSEGGESGN